jgi:hypothetical protein
LHIRGRGRQLQPPEDLGLDRRQGGGREHVHDRIVHAQALLDQAERGEGGEQLGAGDGEVVAALGAQAGEDLPAVLHLPAGLALDEREVVLAYPARCLTQNGQTLA